MRTDSIKTFASGGIASERNISAMIKSESFKERVLISAKFHFVLGIREILLLGHPEPR